MNGGRLRGPIRLLAAITLASTGFAGPRDFGLAELSRALADRKMDPARFRIAADIGTDVPESYRIEGARVTGGDLRGMMYGLLEAAAQIRERGFLVPARGKPSTAMRGVRVVARSGDFDLPAEYWRDYCAMLARNRFNRLNLVTSAGDAMRNLDALRRISQTAADHAIDFTLGLTDAPGEGDLKIILAKCPSIRGVQVTSASDSVMRALADSGRRVTLDVRGGSHGNTGVVPLRYSTPYRADSFGRPRPKPAEFFWELESHGSLLWGDPEYARRAVLSFAATGSAGFEIDTPAARREFERHWLFYMLWGRLAYDPKTPDKAWMSELERRFGNAAGDVLDAYRSAGGIAEAEAGVESRFVASPRETVDDQLQRRASAKQTPLETAEKLHAQALAVEQAIARAAAKVSPENREWVATETDLRVQMTLARYRGRKQLAAYFLAHFYASENDTGLYAARRELTGALRTWQDLVKLSAEAHPGLASAEHDLASVNERVRTWERFGRFDAGFDFGGLSVEPRFRLAGATTRYDDDTGFGWLGDGERLAFTAPTGAGILFGDSIRGRGPQVFRYRSGEGDFTVRVLYPDGTEEARILKARDGVLDIDFPEEWNVSGLVIRKHGDRPEALPPVWSGRPPRPTIAHVPVKKTAPGTALALSVRVSPASAASTIRLYYRPLDASAKFRVMAATGPAATFTIPAAELTPEWDLLYYFEVLSPGGSGWFDPEPAAGTPYYIVEVATPPAPAEVPIAGVGAEAPSGLKPAPH